MVRINPTPLGKLLPRHAEASVTEALADTRVVLVNGARQSGKSTLVGVVAKGRDARWRNLDSAITRQAAVADPVGFVESAELTGSSGVRSGTGSPAMLRSSNSTACRPVSASGTRVRYSANGRRRSAPCWRSGS